MPLIFIDANAWLGFWKVADGRLKGELLPATVSLAEHLFIPSQTAAEVERNKLNCFLTTVQFTQPQLPMALPGHLFAGDDASKWQKDRNALNEEFKRLESEWKLSVRVVAEQISRSEDATTVELRSLFDRAVAESNEQLTRARLRRERGHPPGKQGGKLGDQISWEQILDSAQQQEVWLVSNDDDFSTRAYDGVFLNPFLRRELSERKAAATVFRTIADMIKSAEKAGLGVKGAPSTERLEAIAEEESREARHAVPIAFGGDTEVCPICNHQGLIGPAARPGPYGFAWYSTCRNCGAWIFVDDYDD